MGFFRGLARGLLGPVPPQPHTRLDQDRLAAMDNSGYEPVFYDDGRFSHWAKRGPWKNVAEHKPRHK